MNKHLERLSEPGISQLKYKARLKKFLYYRDGRRCFYCHVRVYGWRAGTIDHIIPKSHRGPLTPENTVYACEPCNNRRGDMPAVDFLYLTRHYRV